MIILVSDWEAYEACWELVLGEGDHSNSSPFIITSYPWASKKEREMIAELCFEKFQIPALYIGNQATFTG
jgi:actin-related protein